jgi:dihydrofolate reductase
MTKVIVDMSLSLDGMITGPDDSVSQPAGGRDGMRTLDWMLAGSQLYEGSSFMRPTGKNWELVDAMYKTTGAVLTGRRTYDFANAWGGSHPITGLPVVVLTHTPPEEAPRGRSRFTYVSNVHEAVETAKRQAEGKDVMTHGASTTQQLLDAGLVDELWLHVAPRLLGAGKPLFGETTVPVNLEIVEVIPTKEAVHLRYRVLH